MAMNDYEQQQGLLEELLALRRDYCDTTGTINLPPQMDTLFSSSWTFDFCHEDHPQTTALCQDNYCLDPFEFQQQDLINSSFSEFYSQFAASDEFVVPQATDSSTNTLDTPPFLGQDDAGSWSMMEGDQEPATGFVLADELHKLEMEAKVEPARSPDQQPVFRVGPGPERKNNRAKKVDGQPSKNLMAERRRRKRLNDRLSMLRSIVPKISKMDRTSILGDTIDYMKELLEKIKNLHQEMEAAGTDKSKMPDIFKGVRTNELLLRNTPKFEVERRNVDTKVEICCTGKPGLLLSTVATLEALGLEIQQCVVSCFNDFNMQASCSEESEHRRLMSSEQIKQALFRNAGYGGRCL